MSNEKPGAQELQARQELENGDRLGNAEVTRAALKRLAALGVDRAEDEPEPEPRAAARKTTPPQDRRAPGKQTS